jgi:transcriptional regulator with XRE-family HTH domain
MTQSFGQYLKQLRVLRGLTLDDCVAVLEAKSEDSKVKVSKYQLSHIENDNRKPNGLLLSLLIDGLALKPDELFELQKVCDSENIAIELPVALRPLHKLNDEMDLQRNFQGIHVVSHRPIELIDISLKNQFLNQLIRKLKDSPSNYIYTYWTIEKSLRDFKIFIAFLEDNDVRQQTIDENIEVIVSTEELSLLSFAIYYDHEDGESSRGKIGRILIRDGDDLESLSSFRIVNMGNDDVKRIYSFLNGQYSYLKKYGKTKSCELLHAKDIRLRDF